MCKHPTCPPSGCRRAVKIKQVYKIKKHSTKRARTNRNEYTPKAKAFRMENPYCKIHATGCTIFTQGVHHTQGKATIELLLDETKWLPACNSCNRFIETHSEWAKENKFKTLNTYCKLTFKK